MLRLKKGSTVSRDLDVLDFSGSVKPETLRILANLTAKHAELERDWYARWERVYLWLSNSVRILGMCLLGFSIIVPLVLGGLDDKARLSWLGWGYATAAVAGLLLSIDRFFLLTESWGRCSLMVVTLDAKIASFRYEGLKALVGLGSAEVPPERTKEVVESCRKFLAEVMTDVATETKEWRTSLNEAVKALAERIGKAAEEAQKRVEAAQQATRTGEVLVRIVGGSRGYGTVRVWVDEVEQRAMADPNWETLVKGLEPNRHLVRIAAKTRDGREFSWNRMVSVKVDESTAVDIPISDILRSGTLRVQLQSGTARSGDITCKVPEANSEHIFRHPNWQHDFIDVPAGRVTVTLSGPTVSDTGVSRTEQVEVVAGQRKDWTFTLP